MATKRRTARVRASKGGFTSMRVSDEDAFDWETGRFTSGRREDLGTLELSSMTYIPPGLPPGR